MEEKNIQEKSAAERQCELLATALDQASKNGGVWLNPSEKTAPRIYPRGVQISSFNALVLALHSDQNDYMTNEFTLFNEAKKRGESVQAKEKGVPFIWYNWNEYVNKKNPDERISRDEYKNLDEKQQEEYKGVRSREVRTLFNIDQTTLPQVDKDRYLQEIKAYGPVKERMAEGGNEHDLRTSVQEFIEKTRDNLVSIHLDGSGIAHYDSRKDIVYLPDEKNYESYKEYANELMRQIVSSTAHPQRLSREIRNRKMGMSPDDSQKHEMLIAELAAGTKMLEMGLPAKLSKDSMKMIDYWQREIKENPHLIDTIEKDMNNAMEMIHKAERGEKVELKERENPTQQKTEGTKQLQHYFIADELRGLPHKDTKEFVIVKDPDIKKADVILPSGASIDVDNEIPGMNKGQIETALQKEGFGSVTFYNADGALGYRPDDGYFAGKDVSISKLNNKKLKEVAKIDVSEAVKKANSVMFDKIVVLKDDDGKWALFMKPENEKSFCVYPTNEDIATFFTVAKQGIEENTDRMRQDMAIKYYAQATKDESLKVDLFKSMESEINTDLIDQVNIFKTSPKENEESKILCMVTIQGEKQKPREISRDQWQRIFLADDIHEYKTRFAATLYADVIQEKVEEKKQEQNSEFQEERSKESKAQEEAKDVKETALSGIVKQFYDLKKRHPDAMLLFRTGDFYETYMGDAEKASQILGITLTKSSRTKDKEGKPLAMAGFPYHALDSYLPKLIRNGCRVAICDQIELPKQSTDQAQAAESKKEEVEEPQSMKHSIHF